MIQPSSTDQAVYERALQSDDPGMENFIKWFENGCKPTDKITPKKEKARWIVVDMLNQHEDKFIKDELGIYHELMQRITARRYNSMSDELTERIIQYGRRNGYGK